MSCDFSQTFSEYLHILQYLDQTQTKSFLLHTLAKWQKVINPKAKTNALFNVQYQFFIKLMTLPKYWKCVSAWPQFCCAAWHYPWEDGAAGHPVPGAGQHLQHRDHQHPQGMITSLYNLFFHFFVKAEGLTAIEAWMLSCILFVFGALVGINN